MHYVIILYIESKKMYIENFQFFYRYYCLIAEGYKIWYNPIFDSQIYQNTAESLILPGFFSGVFSFYYIVFFLNQI